MIHLGDVRHINGAEIKPVDVVCAGSPCQDLSVAGKRKGLQHTDKGDEETTRSGLFIEQMRIIKEMREHDIRNGRTDSTARPRYMLWENVPGTLSSGKSEDGFKGEDFRCVLEETAKIIQEDAVIPRPQNGWHHTGVILLDGGSIAWKIHDSQWWGVPQRRKRLCVLADFNGFTAGEILLHPVLERTTERGIPCSAVGHTGRECRPEVQPLTESMSRNSEEKREAWETVAGDTEDGTGETGWSLKMVKYEEDSSDMKLIYDARGNGNGKVCCSIVGGHQNRITDYTAIVTDMKGGMR